MERQVQVVTTTPTGAAAPRRRNIPVGHMVQIQHLLLSQGDQWQQALPSDPMVLQIVWFPEEWAGQSRGTWLRRVYRGVTIEADAEGDQEGVAMPRETRFHASYLEESSGVGEAPRG